MDFNALIAELRTSSENLPKDSADRSLLSSVYCNKACKVLDQVADSTDYDSTITGLWLVAAHFAEQLVYLKPVPALSELCFKLFRQCAKAVLNIQWQNLEEDSSLKQNFLASLTNLHEKLVPLDFPRFRLLEALTENPWTNPTLAKVMGGEVDDSDKEEVRQYIEQEDPIILQLRVDMMLKENCEEYALNLCNSCLSHPELQSDLGVRKTQLSLLYKLGQEDRLQEECQKLNIQDAVRIIKQLQTSETHRQICTVLAQTFMVQNWIRPSDMEANKELLRLWIRHQLLVDREHDQFKESVWAMAKLSQSTEQIVIFIDVLREECGETFLQLYVDMCIFAINVDKGQMETNKKEGNMEAAGARRSDMASICAKLSCLCHHASLKVARICALTSFALKPTEQSFIKIGTFYGQGTDCCSKCGRDKNREPGTINPATLYEVERLLNMLRPDYLNPDQSYANIQILCRRFLQESLKNAQQQRIQVITTLSDGQTKKPMSASNRPTNVFEALSPQDFQNTQMLLNRMRLQNVPEVKSPISTSSATRHIYSSGTTRPNILQQNQQTSATTSARTTVKDQYVFDMDNIKNKQPYGVPVEQQHQYFLMKHEKELEQRRKIAQKKREEKTQQTPGLTSQFQQQNPQLLQRQQLLQKQQHNDQVTHLIQKAIQQTSGVPQKLTEDAGPGVVRAVLNIMKGAVLKQSAKVPPPQQTQASQQAKQMIPSTQHGSQTLPTVSTLLRPSVPAQLQQPPQEPPQKRHPRPQLYAQPIIVSNPGNMLRRAAQPVTVTLSNRSPVTQTLNTSSVMSSGEKQKAESFMLAKSHVEDIRRFMQLQMSNLQHKQIAQPHQMSGSVVTMKNMPVTTTTTSSAHLPLNMANKGKTTVELAQQAAAAKHHKQDSSKQGIFPHTPQVKINLGQTFTSQPQQMMPKSVQPQYVTSINITHNNIQPQQQQHHLKLLQQQPQSSTYSFHNSPTSTVAQNSVLPSSDELSGSIMGIDDTIIKELLQDSGILANTFPDIEVDTIGDDRSRKIPEISTLPHSIVPSVPSQMSKSTKSVGNSYSSSQMLLTPQRLPATLGSAVTKTGQIPNIAGSTNLPSSYAHLPGDSMNKYSALAAASSCPTGRLPVRTLAPSAPQVYPGTGNQNQIASSLQAQSSTKMTTAFESPIKKEIKQENRLTVDQLREVMKREDIQGEICMDSANNATYRCIICSFAFETLDHLREHVRNVCKPGLQSSSVYNTKIKQDRANSAKAGVETTTVFQCLRCFELCVSDAGIKQHRLTCKRVPTVPSDLKKEIAHNKQKPVLKTTPPKPVVKKELQDNSHKLPEMPLPFPYPSLNEEAVLKSMSASGFSSPSSSMNVCSRSQIPPSNIGMVPKSNVTNTVSVPNTTLKTPIPVSSSFSSGTLGYENISKTTFPLLNTLTVTKQISHSNPLVNLGTISTKAELPEDETPKESVMTTPQVVEETRFSKETETYPSKEIPQKMPEPRFSEITGSGGSKFYKCKICSQTLCSLESFLGHWKECAVKNKSVLKKIEFQEKLANAKPVTGDVLECLLQVIGAVATGDGAIPEDVSLDPEWSDIEDILCDLEDPCGVDPLEGMGMGSSDDPDLEAWDDEEHETDVENVSENESTVDEGRDESQDVMTSKQGEDIHDSDIKELEEEENSKLSEKSLKNQNDSDDEGDSESEQAYSLTSTREEPPQLRDRKTLKPIQSFINETFISPFSKTNMKPANTKSENLKKTLGGEKEDKIVPENETESDGDSLYCKICQLPFQAKRILLQHFAAKHLQPYTVKTVADSSSYFCHLCQKTFSTFMHYMQHVPNHAITICEKMKVFTATMQSSQRSERIATQRGLTTKESMGVKMAKASKRKKPNDRSTVDRLQLLACKTQSVRERLKISKRKRSLPSAFTSSEDEYSSDTSSNVVFKSRKSTERENWSDGQRPNTRSKISNPGKTQSKLQLEEYENSNLSSLDLSDDESDHSPRLSRVHDEDYVLSEDTDSDGMDEKAPPTTRSRKQQEAHNLRHSESKKRKLSADSEIIEGNFHDGKVDPNKGRVKHLLDIHCSDSDADSRSSILLLSQSLNGKYLPSSCIPETPSETSVNEETKADKEIKESVSANCVIVRSLSKRQKQRLKSCDLHPKVVLTALSGEDFHKGHASGFCSTGTATDLKKQSSAGKMSEDEQQVKMSEGEQNVKGIPPSDVSSVSSKSKSNSFFDSFLSYLNTQYSEPDTASAWQSTRKRNNSGPPAVLRQKKRRNSLDSRYVGDVSQSPANLSRGSSTEAEGQGNVDEAEASTSRTTMDNSDNRQNSVKNVLSEFPVRMCSVNLGHKLSLEDLKANIDSLSRIKVPVQNKCATLPIIAANHSGKTEIPTTPSQSPSSLPCTEKKQVPVVCLERSGDSKLYAVKTTLNEVSSNYPTTQETSLMESTKLSSKCDLGDNENKQLDFCNEESGLYSKELQSGQLTDEDKASCHYSIGSTTQESDLKGEVASCIISNKEAELDHISQTYIPETTVADVTDDKMIDECKPAQLKVVISSTVSDLTKESEGCAASQITAETVTEDICEKEQESCVSVPDSVICKVGSISPVEVSTPAEEHYQRSVEPEREHSCSGIFNAEMILTSNISKITDNCQYVTSSNLVGKFEDSAGEEWATTDPVNIMQNTQARSTGESISENIICKNNATCSGVADHTEHQKDNVQFPLNAGNDEQHSIHQDQGSLSYLVGINFSEKAENSVVLESTSDNDNSERAAAVLKVGQIFSSVENSADIELISGNPETVSIIETTEESHSSVEVDSLSANVNSNMKEVPQVVQSSSDHIVTSDNTNMTVNVAVDLGKISETQTLVLSSNEEHNSPITENVLSPEDIILKTSQKAAAEPSVNCDECHYVSDKFVLSDEPKDKDHHTSIFIEATSIEETAVNVITVAASNEIELDLAKLTNDIGDDLGEPGDLNDNGVDMQEPGHLNDSIIDIKQSAHQANTKISIEEPGQHNEPVTDMEKLGHANATVIDMEKLDHPNESGIDIEKHGHPNESVIGMGKLGHANDTGNDVEQPGHPNDTGNGIKQLGLINDNEIDTHQPNTSMGESESINYMFETNLDKPNMDSSEDTVPEFDSAKQKAASLSKIGQTEEKTDMESCQTRSYKKQNSKCKIAVSPSNSLAAFIAERLSKEDLEPESAFASNQVKEFRLVDQDSPLFISKPIQPVQSFNKTQIDEDFSVSVDKEIAEVKEPDYHKQVNDCPAERTVSHCPAERKVGDCPSERQVSDCPAENEVSDFPTDRQVIDCSTERKVSDCPPENEVSDCHFEAVHSHKKDMPLQPTIHISGLVDYSSSESDEEIFLCADQAEVNSFTLGSPESNRCVGEDGHIGLVLNPSDIVQLNRTPSVNEEVSPTARSLELVRKNETAIDAQELMLTFPFCDRSALDAEPNSAFENKYLKKPTTAEFAFNSAGSENCVTLENFAASGPNHSARSATEVHIGDESGIQLEACIAARLEQDHKNEQLVVDQDVLWEIDKVSKQEVSIGHATSCSMNREDTCTKAQCDSNTDCDYSASENISSGEVMSQDAQAGTLFSTNDHEFPLESANCSRAGQCGTAVVEQQIVVFEAGLNVGVESECFNTGNDCYATVDRATAHQLPRENMEMTECDTGFYKSFCRHFEECETDKNNMLIQPAGDELNVGFQTAQNEHAEGFEERKVSKLGFRDEVSEAYYFVAPGGITGNGCSCEESVKTIRLEPDLEHLQAAKTIVDRETFGMESDSVQCRVSGQMLKTGDNINNSENSVENSNSDIGVSGTENSSQNSDLYKDEVQLLSPVVRGNISRITEAVQNLCEINVKSSAGSQNSLHSCNTSNELEQSNEIVVDEERSEKISSSMKSQKLSSSLVVEVIGGIEEVKPDLDRKSLNSSQFSSITHQHKNESMGRVYSADTVVSNQTQSSCEVTGNSDGDMKGSRVYRTDEAFGQIIVPCFKVDVKQTGLLTHNQIEADVSIAEGVSISYANNVKHSDKNSFYDTENEYEKIPSTSQHAVRDKQSREEVIQSEAAETVKGCPQEKASSAKAIDGSLNDIAEKKRAGSETDDGDDLSDFDLVIEKDTSYRSLSFSFNVEKKSYSTLPQHLGGSYHPQGGISSKPLVAGSLETVSFSKAYNKQNLEPVVGKQPGSSLNKALASSRNLRKGSQEQFVWDVDDDNDSSASRVSLPVSLAASLTTKRTAEMISNPALEALKRKQRALREKSETTPFTWDVEDFVETPSDHTKCFLTMQGTGNTGYDVTCSDKAISRRVQNSSGGKIHKRVLKRKRPLTPEVPCGRITVEFRRTSSADKQTKAVAGNGERKRESDGELKNEEVMHLSKLAADSQAESSGKMESQSIKQGILPSTAGHEVKVKRERWQKQSHITSQPVLHQDEKAGSSNLVEEEDPLKNQPRLRSRHSSMESNKSDKSLTTKRSSPADGATSQTSYKRFRKTEDLISPKLRKIGLIKITKDSQSSPAGSDSSAPMTRSSEAAIKAFNQKSLRNRGVNPVQSSLSSALRNLSPNFHLKNSPEVIPRLKGSPTSAKVTPSNSNRNSHIDMKTEQSSKSTTKKSQDGSNVTAAVVKRRSMPVPISLPRDAHTKSPVALRSRKGITGANKRQPASTNTTEFHVDPQPNTVHSKGTFKSQTVTLTKGSKTLHTPVPTETIAVRLKKDTNKQQKWKISKEAKQGRGRNQHRT